MGLYTGNNSISCYFIQCEVVARFNHSGVSLQNVYNLGHQKVQKSMMWQLMVIKLNSESTKVLRADVITKYLSTILIHFIPINLSKIAMSND